MLTMKNGIMKDEKGFFVFGPLWFVLLVMALAFICSVCGSSEKNMTPTESTLEKEIQCPF